MCTHTSILQQASIMSISSLEVIPPESAQSKIAQKQASHLQTAISHHLLIPALLLAQLLFGFADISAAYCNIAGSSTDNRQGTRSG